MPAPDLDRALVRVGDLAFSWRDAGLGVIHLELAGYDSLSLVEKVFDTLKGVITSVGMSHSELQMIEGDAADPAAAMMRLGDRLESSRVCVHADHWAASITKADADREAEALLTGCLLASTRAAAGRPVQPATLDPGVRFYGLPFRERFDTADWHFVACASPYIDRPVTTLGLGDTFTAGCLLALGQKEQRVEQLLRRSV